MAIGYARSGSWKEERWILCSGRDGSLVDIEKINSRTNFDLWHCMVYIPRNNECRILCLLVHMLHVNCLFFSLFFNPILHNAWLDNRALTLKSNTAKFYFGENFAYPPKNLS
jgi:hypothetical protein